MLTGQTGCVRIERVTQWRTSYTWYMNVQLWQQFAALFTADTDTLRSFFAQDHVQVFNIILDCVAF